MGTSTVCHLVLLEPCRRGIRPRRRESHESCPADPLARKRLLREAKTAAALDYPFICKIYETAELGDQGYIAMEYVEGRTLLDRLKEGPLPLRELIPSATESAEALEVAHAHGIVHRDLKPSNIMLGRSGHVKVMDFGRAKQVGLRGRCGG